MSARREDPKLKLLHHPRGAAVAAPAAAARDARVGGIGIEWADEPDALDERGRREWRRLAAVYASQPVRFREGDRAALIAYCAYFAAFEAAAADVAKRGPIVIGRGAKDRGRKVKNPATVVMREAATQLRYWARELGLTPDARGRIGVDETPEIDLTGGPASDNPFA